MIESCARATLCGSPQRFLIAASLVALVAVDVGGAAIEVEFLDSLTGERLAAGVDQQFGKRVNG